MALKNYGVLKGKVVGAQRETDPNSPHYQVHMTAGGKDYRIAVNVKSQVAPSDLLFLVDETFQHPILSKIGDFNEDFHPLSSKPDQYATGLSRLRLNGFRCLPRAPSASPPGAAAAMKRLNSGRIRSRICAVRTSSARF